MAYLSLCYCDQITESGLELLGQIQNISTLDITGCNLTDQVRLALTTDVVVGSDEFVVAFVDWVRYLRRPKPGLEASAWDGLGRGSDC